MREVRSQASAEANFRNATNGARECYGAWHIESDFFPDNKTGRVSISTKSGMADSKFAWLRIDLDGSIVRVYYVKGYPRMADAVEKWLAGDYSDCPLRG